MESKAIEFIKSEGLEEKFEKFKEDLEDEFKEMPKIEFEIIDQPTIYDFFISAYVNGEYIKAMSFDKDDDYLTKIRYFYYMIETVYDVLGVRASRDEMLDETTEKYAFVVEDVLYDRGFTSSNSNSYLIAKTNIISINQEKTKLVYDAISVHREYLREAFRLKEKNA